MLLVLLLQSEAASEVLKRRGTLHGASAADKVEVQERRSWRGTVHGAGAAAACEAAALCGEELFMVLLLQSVKLLPWGEELSILLMNVKLPLCEVRSSPWCWFCRKR